MPSMIGVAAARVLRIALLADKLRSLLPNARSRLNEFLVLRIPQIPRHCDRCLRVFERHVEDWLAVLSCKSNRANPAASFTHENNFVLEQGAMEKRITIRFDAESFGHGVHFQIVDSIRPRWKAIELSLENNGRHPQALGLRVYFPRVTFQKVPSAPKFGCFCCEGYGLSSNFRHSFCTKESFDCP
jgi:hypothetical protein